MKELQILFCTGLTKSLATIFNFARNIFLLTDSCLTFLFNCSQIFVEIIDVEIEIEIDRCRNHSKCCPKEIF